RQATIALSCPHARQRFSGRRRIPRYGRDYRNDTTGRELGSDTQATSPCRRPVQCGPQRPSVFGALRPVGVVEYHYSTRPPKPRSIPRPVPHAPVAIVDACPLTYLYAGPCAEVRLVTGKTDTTG